MKELKLDLLPSNLYAAKRRAEQQKEKEKKGREQQKNIVKIESVPKTDRIERNDG
ncbi:hypothetical protein IMSAGC020_01492 [Lachnospiraceae bacterium]|nr:hypothetical protein IMSAGC020_01492 [Lachnospiraceae bacterium]